MNRRNADGRRLGWPTLVFVGAVSVLVLGALILRVTARPGGVGPRPAASVANGTGRAPVTSPRSLPAGPAVPSAAAAVNAAQAIVAMEPALVSGDDASAARMVATWAASSAAAALIAQVRQERVSFNDAPGGPYSFEVAPLAARTTAADPDDVTVELWCAEVLFTKGAPSYGSYITETLQLTWQGGAWRLGATNDTAGPAIPVAPGKEPTSVEDATSKLAGFEPVGLAGTGS